jgi:hypothetical protein
MTDRAQFEAMLEALINEDQETAKEIFHNIVVGKSREIYEELLAEDFSKDQGNPYSNEEEEEEEEEEESFEPKDSEEEEEGEEEEEEGGDDSAEDDAEDDGADADGEEMPFGDEEGAEGGEGDVEDRVMDLEDALEDLKAEFEMLLKGEEHEEENEPGIHGDGEPMHDIDAAMGGDDSAGEPDELAGLMEYVNKIGVPYGSGAHIAGTTELENVGASTGGSYKASGNLKSTIDNMKNDMGGTTANIAQNHVEVHGDAGVKAGGTKGGLLAPTTKPLIGKVQNTPGTDAGKTGFKTRVKGGGIDAQSGFNQPGKQVGAKDSSGRGESNTQSTLRPVKQAGKK